MKSQKRNAECGCLPRCFCHNSRNIVELEIQEDIAKAAHFLDEIRACLREQPDSDFEERKNWRNLFCLPYLCSRQNLCTHLHHAGAHHVKLLRAAIRQIENPVLPYRSAIDDSDNHCAVVL